MEGEGERGSASDVTFKENWLLSDDVLAPLIRLIWDKGSFNRRQSRDQK